MKQQFYQDIDHTWETEKCRLWLWVTNRQPQLQPTFFGIPLV